ncbi:GRF-type domain-containing protein [Raphanus sativus]|nr:GRF-type domain-containing protein [Raphanus sativus]
MKMQKVKMEVASGSSRRQNSGRRFYICCLPASIMQGWTDRNPGQRFYGCPRFSKGCNYFSWFDEEEGTYWQRQALLHARDEIREKTRVIEQLTQTISEMKSNFENKGTAHDENEDEIVRKFEEFYL